MSEKQVEKSKPTTKKPRGKKVEGQSIKGALDAVMPQAKPKEAKPEAKVEAKKETKEAPKVSPVGRKVQTILSRHKNLPSTIVEAMKAAKTAGEAKRIVRTYLRETNAPNLGR